LVVAAGGPAASATKQMMNARVFGNTREKVGNIADKITGKQNWNLGGGVDRLASGVRNLDDTAKDFFNLPEGGLFGKDSLFGDPVDVGDPGDSAKVPNNLDPSFAGRLRRLFDAAPFDITISSGRRSTADQERIFFQRHDQVPAGTKGAKLYKGKWWKHVRGAAVAVPGTSKHEKGHAVDLRIDGQSANSHRGWQAWADANIGAYGLRTGKSFGEWWHVETPGKVSEAAVGSEATPVPDSGTGGGRGGGFGVETSFLGGIGVSLTSMLQNLSGAPGKVHVPGAGGGGAGGSGGGAGGAGGGTGTNGAGSGSILAALRAAGFSGESLRMAYAIGMAESGGNTAAHGDQRLANSTWGHSIGFFQIRSLNAQKGTGKSRDATRLEDIGFNARSAWEISGGGKNWNPWTQFKTGAYKQFLDPNIGDPDARLRDPLPQRQPAQAASIAVGGSQSITIQSLKLEVKIDQVNEHEAERLARMTIDKIAEQGELAALGRS
jgi:hypothetical protein